MNMRRQTYSARGSMSRRAQLIFAAFSALLFSASARAATLYGDANQDGTVSIADINLTVDWILGRVPMTDGNTAFYAADVNQDGLIGMADLNLMVDDILGRISTFPAEDMTITLAASGTSLKAVCELVSQQAGVRVTCEGALEATPIFLTVTNMPFQQYLAWLKNISGAAAVVRTSSGGWIIKAS